MHGTEAPSAWVQRWSHLVPAGGSVLDVACGHGRHLRWFAGRGHPVTGVDRSPEAITAVAGLGRAVEADGLIDVSLNASTYWKSIPTAVWEYTLGGYQVLKKWLSYRETAVLGRPLKPEEAREFMHIARRIAALLALNDALDVNYRAVTQG